MLLYCPGLFSARSPSHSKKGRVGFFCRQTNTFNEMESILQLQLKVVRMQDSKATAVGCFRYQAAFSCGWKAGLVCLRLCQLSLKMALGRSSSGGLTFPQSSSCLQWWTEGPACCWVGRFVCLGFRYHWAFMSALSVGVSEVDSQWIEYFDGHYSCSSGTVPSPFVHGARSRRSCPGDETSACSQKPSMNTPAITAETGDPIGLLLNQCWVVHPFSLRSSLSALGWRVRPRGSWPWCHLAQPVDSTARG